MAAGLRIDGQQVLQQRLPRRIQFDPPTTMGRILEPGDAVFAPAAAQA